MSFETANRAGTALQSEPFEYVPTPGGNEAGNGGADSSWAVAATATVAQSDKKEKEAYERGLLEGENRVRANYEACVAASQEAIRTALESFRIERDEYFSRIEPEVVQLALAIARKILHRESQIDPLLLTGLVHVALEQLEAGSRVRLKVHPDDTHLWNEFFARTGGALLPELSGDSSLQHGECLLETQLKEIEQGFFDLLEQRPRAR
jgi:flagellar assembly protein FliH